MHRSNTKNYFIMNQNLYFVICIYFYEILFSDDDTINMCTTLWCDVCLIFCPPCMSSHLIAFRIVSMPLYVCIIKGFSSVLYLLGRGESSSSSPRRACHTTRFLNEFCFHRVELVICLVCYLAPL